MSPQEPRPEVPDDAESPSTPPADEAGGQGTDAAVTSEASTADGEQNPDDAGGFTTEQIDAIVAERDDYLDRLQRSHAELENYRKQTQKRLADEGARTLAAFVERMLPVLDALEAAEVHGSTDVEAISTQLFSFLEKEGLERVSPAGEVFDPNVAEAVVHEPGDGDEPVVTEVLRTGYLWNGRVIRAAMVKVAG